MLSTRVHRNNRGYDSYVHGDNMNSQKELKALEDRLKPLETHAQAIRMGEVDNDWCLDEWRAYRHLKVSYHHLKRLSELKPYKEKRFSLAKFRRYLEGGVI